MKELPIPWGSWLHSEGQNVITGLGTWLSHAHTNTVMLEKAASQPPAARLHPVSEALPSPISRKTEETVNHRVRSTPPRCFQLQPALNVKSIIGQPLTNHIMSWPESAMADVTKKKKKIQEVEQFPANVVRQTLT